MQAQPILSERILAGAWAEAKAQVAAERRFARYRPDPARYAAEVLGVHWWAKQIEIAESIRDNRRTAVKAGNGLGKTHALGGIVQWHYDCFDPGITLTTAPVWASIHDLLWGEIKSQRRPDAPGRLMDLRLDGGPIHYAKGHNAESAAGFQGRHEARQLIVLDEAMGIPPYIWQATDTMMAAPDCRVVASGNPTETSGQFYEIASDPNWNVITISCLDHPNIAAALAGEPIPYPKAVSLTWVMEMLDKHAQSVTAGEAEGDSACFEFPVGSGLWYRPNGVFRARVLGLFPRQASESVWDEAWLERARRTVLMPAEGALPEIGVDVARFGDDETVLYGGVRPAPTHHEGYARQDLMATVGRVARLADRLAEEHQCDVKSVAIKIDDTGLGGGVTDRLAELGYQVHPIVAGSNANDPGEYYNRRSELWFVAAGMARKGQLDLTALPHAVYSKLSAELRGVRYKIQSDKTLRVESKDDYKKRVGRSPDDADAFNLWALPVTAVPAGASAAANPVAPSRFTSHETGSRWGRGDNRRGWRSR